MRSGSTAAKNSGWAISARLTMSPSSSASGEPSASWRLRLTCAPCAPTLARPSTQSVCARRWRNCVTCSGVSTPGICSIILLSFVEKSPCDYRIAGAAADTENGNGSHLSTAGIAQNIAEKLPQTQMRISLIFFNKFKLVKCGELLENGFYSQAIYVKKTENRRFRSKTRKILRYHAGIARPVQDAPPGSPCATQQRPPQRPVSSSNAAQNKGN